MRCVGGSYGAVLLAVSRQTTQVRRRYGRVGATTERAVGAGLRSGRGPAITRSSKAIRPIVFICFTGQKGH